MRANPSAVSVALAGALLLAAAMGIGRFAYTPLLPPLQEALGWSVSQSGDIASANFMGYLIGALAAFWLASRSARWPWLVAGMVLSAGTTLGGAFAISASAWLALRFFSGVASAVCLVFGTALVLDQLAALSRPQLGAVHFAGVGMGVVLSVAIIESARWIGGSVFDYWAWLGVASLALFAFAWALLRRVPRQDRTEHNQGQGFETPGRSRPAIIRLVFTYGLFGFGYVVTATFIVAMVRRSGSAGELESLIWIVVGLFAIPSVLFWQRVALRIGLLTALRLALAVEAGGVLLAGFGQNGLALVVGGALLGATFMGITALGLVAARRLAGAKPDGIIALMTGAFGLGQFLGPAVAGRLAQTFGGFGPPSFLAAFLLLVGVALLRPRPVPETPGALNEQ